MPINQKKVQSNSSLSKRLHNLLCLIDVHILFCKFSFPFFFFLQQKERYCYRDCRFTENTVGYSILPKIKINNGF